MAFKTTLDIDSDKLAGEITRIDEISDRVRLASFALATPLLDLRLAQMGREVQRVAAKKGADHPDVAARQAALGRATARFSLASDEMSRARLDMPSLKSDQAAGLWGRVAENGVAVANVTVVASTAGRRVGFHCTDANGGFAMEVPSDTPLVLSVRSPEGAEIHRDTEAQSLAAGQQQYREIDLGRGASKPCPEPPPDEQPRTDTFPMVNLVGQREADAMAILRAQGLTLGKRSEEPNETRVGLVLAQDPKPRTRVRRGDVVDIVVATSGKVTVPSLIGLTRADAEKALREIGLAEGEVTFVPVAREKAGLVTNQNPAAGTRSNPGDKVALEIGRETRTPPRSDPARDTVAMPDLIDRTEAASRAMLDRLGLTLANRREEQNAERTGRVVAQHPSPNTRVKRGDSVGIVVAASAKVTVPSVIGLTRADAEKALREAGLAKGRVTLITVAPERAGLVAGQAPLPDSQAERGDKLSLQIGRGVPAPPRPRQRGQS